MTPEARIASLEKQLAQLNSRFDTLVEIVSNLSGGHRAFHQAVLALVKSAPPSALLDAALPDMLARAESNIVNGPTMETYLDGMQEAQRLIMAHHEESHRLHAR
jgi:hypothetical protein